MRPRIKLTRIHQVNGPDYWQADCYIADHTLQTVGTTVQKALNDMYPLIDNALHPEWILAHWMNEFYDEEKERDKKLFPETPAYVEVPAPPPKWHWTKWFWNPQD